MTARIHIGCSGWQYRHWRGGFYPEGLPVSRWFAHYTATFDTVEINNSFYRRPPLPTFARWRDQAPAGFRYAVKANRFLTQAHKLKDCAEPLERLLPGMAELGTAGGPLLFQLPPRFRLNLDRLASFLALLPANLVSVFEFRDPSWYVPDVLALLDCHGAGFCAHDLPGLATPRWACGDTAYVRFHCADGKYRGRYANETLSGWADWMVEQSASGRETWAFFNNDIDGDAPRDALTLRTTVARAIGRVPSRTPPDRPVGGPPRGQSYAR